MHEPDPSPAAPHPHLARRPAGRWAAAGLAALLTLPAAARANGFALDIQGTLPNGTAGAGAGLARDPSVMFVNPAGLAALDGTRLSAGGMLVFPRAAFADGGSTLPVGLTPTPGQGGDGARTGAVPWLFASHRLSPGLTVGFGLAAPFGLATDYGRDAGFTGRYQGIESRIEALAFGPAVAWRVAERLAVGAGVSARRDRVVQSLALDMGSVCVAGLLGAGDPDPAATCAGTFGLAPGQSDGYGRFEGTGWSWSAAVGATFEPVEGTTLGAAWRHEARGAVRGDETFELPAGATAFLAATGAPQALTGSRAGMRLPLPDFLTLHGAQRVGPVTLLAAAQWTRWRPFDVVALRADSDGPSGTGLTIASPQRYRDAWRLALGAAWAVRPGLDLFGGLAYEETPIRLAYRQATLPERDSIILGLGGEVALPAGLSLSLGWQHVQATGVARVDQPIINGDHLTGSAHPRADLVLAQAGWRG